MYTTMEPAADNKIMGPAEQYWEAVQTRDRGYDGKFYYGVITTGVFCRPSCPARLPLRKNVRFYETPAEAAHDGLRPCLRCRPLSAVGADPDAARMSDICRYIEAHATETLTLAGLAARAGLSPFHFQRSFKAAVGATPKQYQEIFRVERLKDELRGGGDVTEAVYEAGFGSSSRVYERADTRLGMTPNQYRRQGDGATITYASAESPAGPMMIGATDRGVCFVQFGGSTAELLSMLQKEYPKARLEPMREPGDPEFQRWIRALADHLKGEQPRLDLPLDIRATAFQMRVWNYLQSIPYGETQSYAEVAAGIGQPKAVRAVASACAKNRVALMIPCHRVIRGTGDLGGYRWGLARKQAFLERERGHAAS
jgi:AraC family transcriptional regulator of adaptative response/methylated-DNA-[protein]-cysteine methyltransferase